jgi:class 3 adenylate cyclase
MSVFSFLKIIAKLNKYNHILKYNENTEMNNRVEGFRVKMGFGLHQGWAIEGAIGSFFKIDASYLSPNVNMAARLEAATG